jgi:hypothetical protein
MREEARKGACITLCVMCHGIRPTGTAGRCIDTVSEAQALPNGKSRGTPDEVQAYDRKRLALIRAERYEYNNALKRTVGRCENPVCKHDGLSGGRVQGFEHCFGWHHLGTKPKDEPGDPRTIAAVCCWTKRVPKEEWQRRIDEDRKGCELLCLNCLHECEHGAP